jgi:hypothetical protein
MNWLDRAVAIRRFYAEREVSPLVGWRRARAGRGGDGKLNESFGDLIERAVTSITTYHEAGESDEAFATLRIEAAALAAAAARPDQRRVATGDSFVAIVRIKVQLMYGATTAERLMVAFECGSGPAGRPRSRRT